MYTINHYYYYCHLQQAASPKRVGMFPLVSLSCCKYIEVRNRGRGKVMYNGKHNSNTINHLQQAQPVQNKWECSTRLSIDWLLYSVVTVKSIVSI